MGLPNSKQPKEDSKSYQPLKSAINDPLIPEKFRFLLKQLQNFLCNFKEPSCHKRTTEMLIKIELSDLQKSGKISDTQLFKFKSDVVSFISALCAHLVENSPIKYSFTRNAPCFIPNLLLEIPETSEKRFNHLLEALFTSHTRKDG